MATIETVSPRLERHIIDTYFNLRVGMGGVAVAFPVLLWGVGAVAGTSLQESMSAYYHTPVRDEFVGILFALGFFLALYKGFSRQENLALNAAAGLAVGIAIFPTDAGVTTTLVGRLHGACAVSFFISIAYVAVFRSGDTLYLVEDRAVRARYQRAYRLLGALMVVLPLTAWGLFSLLSLSSPGSGDATVFFVEAAAGWVFGAYWLTKTRELETTRGDRAFLPPALRAPRPSRDASVSH